MLFFSNRKVNFNKKETESKIENPTNAYKNQEFKIKLWLAEANEKKRVHYFQRLFCPKKIFSVCILP